MPKQTEINQDNFELLLEWLDSDREKAGHIYESIRQRLIKIFYARGFCAAEEMADETIDRVTGKIKKLSETYQGERALYFYAVAKKVFLEYSRKPRLQELPATLVKETVEDESEVYYECLDKCLAKMPPDRRSLLVEYYQGEKQAKIEQRKLLRSRLGISSQALRVRLLRLREELQKCVLSCVQKKFC
jgi:DNA-directed RNA polymerase specialized sigma24 family protein